MEGIAIVEAELTISRKGSIAVSIDMLRRLLRWRESNRWNRNFTRSLSMLEIDELKIFLENCHFENWEDLSDFQETSDENENFHLRWRISLYDKTCKLVKKMHGQDALPEDYAFFGEGLSHFCRRPFKVSD